MEYSVDVDFKTNDVKNSVKIKIYTTSCRFQIQNVGSTHEKKPHLGNEFVPKYFAQTFIMPLGQIILTEVPDLDQIFIPLLANELERLQKLEKKNVVKKNKPVSDVKCVNKSCQWKKIDVKNKSAFGTCDICQAFEHYSCAGTQPQLKEDIRQNIAKFVCTACFESDPLLGK